MAFADHFSSVSKSYASYRPTYPDALFQWLAGIVSHRDKVWDCACGNGQAAQGLAKYFNAVIATDASAAQIAEASPHARIDYRVATAENSGLDDQSINLVTVSQAIHWFNIDAFYREVRRVLKPEGILAVWGYGWLEIDNKAIAVIVDDFQKNILDAYWPPETDLVDAHYKTIPFPFKERTAPLFPLEISWTLDQLLGHFRSWSATARFVKAQGYDPVEKVKLALHPLWGNPSQPHSFKWPLFMRVGQV